MPGQLLLVSTPIGNLDDLSERARRALEEADAVACEDTRRTGLLLSRLGFKRRLLSLHEHNERQRIPQILELLEQGQSIALVSDAGTPLLADPGFPLVRSAVAAGVRVVPVPGASAVLAALVASGLPPHPFTFVGFPPPKSGKRQRFFGRFDKLDHTIVFYESPHRLLACLGDAIEVLGDRPATVGREITKLHEEWLRGSLGEILDDLRGRPALKGEFVVVVGGLPG